MQKITNNAKWLTLTDAEKEFYRLEVIKAYALCENIRLQFREYQLRPTRSAPSPKPFSLEVERAKTLDLLAWKFEQAHTVYDALLVKHMQG